MVMCPHVPGQMYGLGKRVQQPISKGTHFNGLCESSGKKQIAGTKRASLLRVCFEGVMQLSSMVERKQRYINKLASPLGPKEEQDLSSLLPVPTHSRINFIPHFLLQQVYSSMPTSNKHAIKLCLCNESHCNAFSTSLIYSLFKDPVKHLQSVAGLEQRDKPLSASHDWEFLLLQCLLC